jgi:DNA-binding NarL/FixJ family response regulator
MDAQSGIEPEGRAQRALASMKTAPGRRIRVLLADDHALLRESLSMLLRTHDDEIEVVGGVENGRDAVEAATSFQVDVVLMDMRMPAMNGVEATRLIRKRSPGTRVLVLTGLTENEHVLEALRAGASGYIAKQSDVKELLVAIQAVHRGNPYFSGVISDGRSATDLLMDAQTRPGDGSDPLTSREREILQLVAEGNSNQAIADQLFLSVKTVEAHKAHIMTKLHVQNHTDLIRYALRKGIISLDAAPEDESGGHV